MSDGYVLSGQYFDPSDGLKVPFTEQMKDYTGPKTLRVTGNENGEATEILPNDYNSAKVRITDVAAIQAQLATIEIAYDDTIDLQLPDVLVSVAITYNQTSGSGAETHPTSQQEFLSVVAGGDVAQGAFTPQSSAQGSAAVMPDIQPTIKRYWTQNLPVRVYLFYVAEGTTAAQIRTRLATASLAGATVNAWPTFQPVSHTITLKGQQVSVRSSADSRASLAVSTKRYDRVRQWGNGYSKEVGVTIRSVTLPETLHGAITFSGTTTPVTETASADVDASTIAIEGETDNGSFTTDAISNNPSAVTQDATGSVTPTSLSATTPAAIPASGLYVYKVYSQPYKYDYMQVRAVVFDFASIT